MRTPTFFSVLVLLLAGCGVAGRAPAPAAPARSTSALVVQNGIPENGIPENGIPENGIPENGIPENGEPENGEPENGEPENGVDLSRVLVKVAVGSAVVPGVGSVHDAHLQGAALVGSHAHQVLAPADFVGAKFKGTMGNGDGARVRIAAHGQAAAPDTDLDTYLVEWRSDASGGAWHPMCPDGKGGNLYAVPVYGYWDYTQGTPTGGAKTESTSQITFACPNGAIGKCIHLGYRPWSTYAANGQRFSLAPYHQACTRSIRADYCGDGTPHTKNGETIELYDNLGIEVNDRPSWIPEAQWAPRGATCLNPSGVGATPPVACFNALARSSCTANDPSAMISTSTELGRRIP